MDYINEQTLGSFQINLRKTLHLKVGVAVLLPFPFFMIFSYELNLRNGLLTACLGYLAYLLIITIHELGHAAMAWMLGLKVTAIELHLFHGLCRFIQGNSNLKNIAVYWGGALAQLLLFCAAVIYSVYFPIQAWLTPAYVVLTGWNLIVMIGNLQIRARHDGAIAWKIFPLGYKLICMRLNLPIRICGSPFVRNVTELCWYLLTTPDLTRHLEAMGTKKEPLLTTLIDLSQECGGTVSDVISLIEVTKRRDHASGGSGKITPSKLFIAQMLGGNTKIRTALDLAGLNVRDLLFRISHGIGESQFTAQSDIGSDADAAVTIVNDNVTPMEFVVQLLMKNLSISRAEAIVMMQKVHNNGSAIISICARADAERLAAAINSEARQEFTPLFCRLMRTGGKAR